MQMRSKSSLLVITIALLATNCSARAAEKVVVPKHAMAIYAPAPKYPLFALMRHEEGSGTFVFRVDIKSGLVKAVIVARSTGHADLDAAAMKAFKRWKFEPGAVPSIKQIDAHSKDPLASRDGLVKAPISFTIR